MSSQGKSPLLKDVRLKTAQLREVFTLRDVATYWRGYLEIGSDDRDASADYRQVIGLLIEAVQDDRLVLLEKPQKPDRTRKSGGGFANSWREPAVQNLSQRTRGSKFADLDWPKCKVAREHLRGFAESIGVRPAFLFPDSDTHVISGWPWGEHDTELLQKLRQAVIRFWLLYDPEDHTTAPTNEQVTGWLVSEGVSKRVAEVMAQILRDDDLPSGPRKR